MEKLSDYEHAFTFGLGPATIKFTVDININEFSLKLTGTIEIIGFTIATIGPIELSPNKPVNLSFDAHAVSGYIKLSIQKQDENILLNVEIGGKIIFKSFGPISKTIKIWPW